VATNINTAGVDELQRLPRVGPAIAARIVAYRQANGRFRTAEAIQDVKGIGPKTFEKMAPWIRL
jgi:competence protein ComEA